VVSFTIDTLPPANEGVLFLGDPANGGVAVTAGQVLTPAQISQLFFRSTGTFTGANFTYTATDDQGAGSLAATVSLIPPQFNEPPVPVNTNSPVAPNATINLTGLIANDPDSPIASYKIDTLPATDQGVLFLGDPAKGGVAVTPGQVLTPAQISQLFFRATGAFTGASFTGGATDTTGLPSPAPLLPPCSRLQLTYPRSLTTPASACYPVALSTSPDSEEQTPTALWFPSKLRLCHQLMKVCCSWAIRPTAEYVLQPVKS